jgi:triacylglycerol lipase
MEQFQPDAVGYSLANAQALVQAARLSYKSPQEITQQVWSWGFSQFKFLDCDTTQAYVMGDDRAIVVAFRGTEMKKMQDWMTDLKANLKPECGGKVHKGFQDAIDHIWEQLLVTILQFRQQDQRVFLVGHSLGGALATLASVRLMRAHQPVAALYTYGSPRVGDRDFRAEFNGLLLDRAFRFINDEDGVARLPMKMLGYCHVGQKFRFDSLGRLDRSMPSQYSFLSHAKDEIEEYLDPDFEFVKDHDLESYHVMIENLSRSLQTV